MQVKDQQQQRYKDACFGTLLPERPASYSTSVKPQPDLDDAVS
jgi:hypothetical protein